MKVTFLNGVSLMAVMLTQLIASANTVPVPVTFVNNEDTFKNLNKNYEVVEGPREFLAPLGQFKDIWGMQRASRASRSDLDYMVYGKVYLMKALGIADRSSFPIGEAGRDIVLTRSGQTFPSKATPPIMDVHKDEVIQFPNSHSNVQTPNKEKRRYKFQTLPKSLSSNDENSSKHLELRKLHERSTEPDDSIVAVDPETKNTAVPNNNKSFTTSPSVPSRSAAEDSTGNLDEEALDLLGELGSFDDFPTESSSKSPLPLTGTTSTTTSSQQSFNKDSDDHQIYVDDRFLINVPDKPEANQCPEGQRRTHHGVCKPKVVHNHSPHDGIFNGKITPSASSSRAVAVVKNLNGDKNSSSSPSQSQLAALFRTFVQLEKRLEKAVTGAEKELSEIGSSMKEENKADGNEKKS